MTSANLLQSPAALGPLYQDYAYGYPHKSAYRAFTPPRSLKDLWASEDTSRVFLYLHIPFCEMRCGFCNLFTTANPKEDRVTSYLSALERELTTTLEEIGPITPAQIALGGGTPTFLTEAELTALFDMIESRFHVSVQTTPLGIETSPKTATRERLALLSARGTDRISIGVQSFIEAETKAMGRPQKPGEADAALTRIREHRFGRLNLDLIYGAANQTPDSWLYSLNRAMEWAPEEVYLYPLYVRTRTGLDGKTSVEDEHRRTLYRIGRDFLTSEGYHQTSMRAFRRSQSGASGGAEYVCQEDGMLGLGAGARSYTKHAHYSADYAVSRPGVLGILDNYASLSADEFRAARHGIEISDDDRQRRFILKSILHTDGLDLARFKTVFGHDAQTLFPQLGALITSGLLKTVGATLVPTASGLEHSDAIPPLFYSQTIRNLMHSNTVA